MLKAWLINWYRFITMLPRSMLTPSFICSFIWENRAMPFIIHLFLICHFLRWLVEALPLHDERVAIHLSSMVDEILWVEVVLLELQLILQEVLLGHNLLLLRCDHVRLVVQWLPFMLLIRLHTLLLPICHKWLLFLLCKNYWL